MKPNETTMLEVLQKHFTFQTAILYGSQASGEASTESDYDLLLIKKDGPRERKILETQGICLDVIVDPEGEMQNLSNYLYLFNSNILKDESGLGAKLVASVKDFLAKPPRPIPPERTHQRKKQSLDLIRYAAESTALGNYRRHWLLFNLLPQYFDLRQKWFLGDKNALNWLRENDPGTFKLFERAFEPSSSIKELKNLVEHVFDTASV